MKDFDKLTSVIDMLVKDIRNLSDANGHRATNNVQRIGGAATGREASWGAVGGVSENTGDDATNLNTDKIEKLDELINGRVLNDVAIMTAQFKDLMAEFRKLNANISNSNAAPSVPLTFAAIAGAPPSAEVSPSNQPPRTIPAPRMQPQIAPTHQPRQAQQQPPRMPNMQHRNNYDDDYLDKVKEFKATCILVFKLQETYSDERQRDVDRKHISQILSDLNLEHLESSLVDMSRLGTRDSTKIRPLKIEFQSNWVRERIMSCAWMLRHSIAYSSPNYPEGIFLNRDLTKEDRVIEKNLYMQRKQQRIAARGNNPDINIQRRPTADAQQNSTAAEGSTAAGQTDHSHPQGTGEGQQP